MENQTTATGKGLEMGEANTDFLGNFVTAGFRSDLDAAALALGRDAGDIRRMIDGEEPVDEDLEMKARGIAQERNFEI